MVPIDLRVGIKCKSHHVHLAWVDALEVGAFSVIVKLVKLPEGSFPALLHTPEVIAQLPGYSAPRVQYYGSYSAQSGVQTIYGGLSGGYGQYLSVFRLSSASDNIHSNYTTTRMKVIIQELTPSLKYVGYERYSC